MRRATWLLLFPDPIAAHLLTAGASVSRLIELASLVVAESERKGAPRGSATLNEAIANVDKTFKRRNDLLHNITLPSDIHGQEAWKYRRSKDDPEVIPAGYEQLKALLDEVDRVTLQLWQALPDPEQFEKVDPYM